jgi:hypothetical protein
MDQRPSQNTSVYWLVAKRMVGSYPSSTPSCGKWLLFVHVSEIDAAWEKVKKATEDGLLGETSKVSTARPNPTARYPDKNVICVYTYDSDDYEDVSKIRETLRQLGFVDKISYKTDFATLQGKYEKNGSTDVSKYFE